MYLTCMTYTAAKFNVDEISLYEDEMGTEMYTDNYETLVSLQNIKGVHDIVAIN